VTFRSHISVIHITKNDASNAQSILVFEVSHANVLFADGELDGEVLAVRRKRDIRGARCRWPTRCQEASSDWWRDELPRTRSGLYRRRLHLKPVSRSPNNRRCRCRCRRPPGVMSQVTIIASPGHLVSRSYAATVSVVDDTDSVGSVTVTRAPLPYQAATSSAHQRDILTAFLACSLFTVLRLRLFRRIKDAASRSQGPI